MIRPGAVLTAPHPTETVEILSTPNETPGRYRVRLTAPPGGGPGIKGLGPHRHSGLIEQFRCISGAMRIRVGRDVRDQGPGADATVPAGTIHGFLNIGDGPLVVDVDLVFTDPGPRRSADLVEFWAIVDRLIRDGQTDARTGMPPLPQLAVLMRSYPEAFTQPGLPGLLMGPLAIVGWLRGYRSVPGRPSDE